MQIKVVIIDDEKDAIEALTSMIEKFIVNVKIEGSAQSVIDGIKLIKKTEPDIVLLDINMPGNNGFELLDSFPERKFGIIFTSASNDFGIQAVKAHAHDYLLKPIDLDELQESIFSYRLPARKIINNDSRIALPDQNGYTYVKVSDIIHIDGDGNYATVHYKENKKAVVSKNIKHFETDFSNFGFYRCHQSHIINLSEVTRLSRMDGTSLIMSNGNHIKVSRSHRTELLKLLNG